MIEKYLLATCLTIIDEFNEKYKSFSKDQFEKMKSTLDVGYSEADLVFRIGYSFKHMAGFDIGMKNATGRFKENDIVIKEKDFRIEVKFLKSHKTANSKRGTRTNKIPWKQMQGDFNWLENEIREDKNNKGKRAFVIGWFNSTKRFSDKTQLGGNAKKGSSRTIDDVKINYFPFLKPDDTKDTKKCEYRYDNILIPYKLSIPGEEINCLFLGKPDDKFYIAIYY